MVYVTIDLKNSIAFKGNVIQIVISSSFRCIMQLLLKDQYIIKGQKEVFWCQVLTQFICVISKCLQSQAYDLFLIQEATIA